jgi:hypothetical protein
MSHLHFIYQQFQLHSQRMLGTKIRVVIGVGENHRTRLVPAGVTRVFRVLPFKSTVPVQPAFGRGSFLDITESSIVDSDIGGPIALNH